jgi:hypothetical protein
MGAICLLIRVKLLKHLKRSPKQFRICVSQDQVNARDALFRLYLNGAGQEELRPALHTLLVSLLCHYTSNSKLGCPTDYSTCLACLKDPEECFGWGFKKPSEITGVFTRLQYCFRMVYFTHCYTIACHGGVYQALPSPSPVAPSPPIIPTPPIPPATAHTPPSTHPSSDYSILLDLEEWEGNEGILEAIDPVGNQTPEHEEDIEDMNDEEGGNGLLG